MTLYNHSSAPNIFGTPLGADFPRALVDGLIEAYRREQPEALARVHLIVNTRRMARRVTELFEEGGARLLPRISLISETDSFTPSAQFPPATSKLQRQIELAPLIRGLIEKDAQIAPRSAVFELSASLVDLVNEMHEQAVSPESVSALDVSMESAHWQRMQAFMGIVQSYLNKAGGTLDAAQRQRLIVDELARSWRDAPPAHPIILAGSTGSRGPTSVMMQAVAALPLGAVVLPGFDFDFAARVWPDLGTGEIGEDHPQYRFEALLQALELRPCDVRKWISGEAPEPARNKLLSLALRPAPVTDQWLSEGQEASLLLPGATETVTLLEAQTQRLEALAIALRLRQAAEAGTAAALITPDRTLARQVTAALDRWGIRPDDSAGEPLHLSPLGRFMRLLGQLMEAAPVTAELLIALLKHPLCRSPAADRGTHLRLTRELELHIRRKSIPYPDADALAEWAARFEDASIKSWADWVADAFLSAPENTPDELGAHVDRHISLAEALTCDTDEAGKSIWERADGEMIARIFADLADCPSEPMSLQDYLRLLDSALTRGEMRRDTEKSHPGILIWGTLEARVQGVDLLILAGLNEGTWPETPAPDPWLNRSMRAKLGLLLPERRIGLSAHDFQQAAAAKEVWFSRALRSDDAETVASRWLIRLTNLLEGLPNEKGGKALKEMRRKGNEWIARAMLIDMPEEAVSYAPRPAPAPPIETRPRQLSITEIQKLIRDPYAIYAKHVLRLAPLNPLQKAPDALLRGNALHKVMEEFVEAAQQDASLLSPDALRSFAERVLARDVPFPAARLIWQARFDKIIDELIEAEETRLEDVTRVATETQGKLELPEIGFTLKGKADRFDMREDGTLAIYDYKSGSISNTPVRKHFDKQLQLTAAMTEGGAFKDIPLASVSKLAFLGLGSEAKEVSLDPDEYVSAQVLAELRKLIGAFMKRDKGYPSRRAVDKESHVGDYDHLARYGEWNTDTEAVREMLE